MADTLTLIRNSLWSLGLLLGFLSLATALFRSLRTGQRLSKAFNERAFQLPFSAAMVLLTLGLLLSGRTWWEWALWGLLAFIFTAQFVRVLPKRDPPAPPAPSRTRAPDRVVLVAWGLVLGGILLLAAWLAVSAVQGLRHTRSLRDHLTALEATAQRAGGDVKIEELEAAAGHLQAIESDLAALRRIAGPLLPVTRLFGWVPGYGGELAAAGDMMTLAHGVSSAGSRAAQSVLPSLSPPEESGSSQSIYGDSPGAGATMPERLVSAFAGAEEDMQQAQYDLAAAQAALQRIDVATLSPRVQGLLAQLDRYLPWLEAGVSLSLLVPDLGGEDGPRTYLILAQNSQELRATGGFISGVGELHVEGGRVMSLEFGDSYQVDNLEQEHELAPPDFQNTLLGQLVFFRDSNWDPDFPTSARRALAIYAQDRGVEADGVIALDLIALRALVGALEPLYVEGIDEPVTHETVLDVIQTLWREPTGGDKNTWWWFERKDFMGQIAGAAMDRLSSGQNLDLGRLALAVVDSLDQKHVLVYLEDPQAAQLMRERDWDGALLPASGDSDALMVVDSNVGFNKMDARIKRSIRYRVDLSREGAPRSELSLTYRNRAQKSTPACVQESRYGETYADMMERCYWDYVRVYVPQGSVLLDSPEIPLPPGSLLARYATAPPEHPVGPVLTEGDWTAWTSFFDLAPGEQRSLDFGYELPTRVTSAEPDGVTSYALTVQKQPGTEAVPIEVEIVLPEGSELVGTPAGYKVAVDGSVLRVATDLRTDREFLIRYRLGGVEP